MKYLLECIGRAVALVLSVGILYSLLWLLPVIVGEHLQKNQYTTKACSDAGRLCQWAEGGMALFVWGIAIFFVVSILVFIFVGPKKVDKEGKI